MVFLAEFLELVQVTAAAKWRVHFVGIVKKTVVDSVLPSVLTEGYERLEPVTPFDLGRQVGRAGLCSHAGRLNSTLKDNDNFEFVLKQIGSRHVVKRGVGRDFVNDRHGPDEEKIALVVIETDFQLVLKVRYHLSFVRHSHLNHLGADAGVDYVRFAHIAHTEHQTELIIPLADCS